MSIERESKMPMAAWTGVILSVFTLIWASGAAYQRLIVLESEVGILQKDRASNAEVIHVENELNSRIRELELQLQSSQALERAFSRSICVALSHTQTQAGVPITNDCDRP